MTRNQRNILIGGVAVIALAATAAASSYVTRSSVAPQQLAAATPVPHARVVHHTAQPQQVASRQPACDDRNIVGTVGGGLAGGVVGHQFGKGQGRTAATVVGAAGGALLGHEYIPTQGATCN